VISDIGIPFAAGIAPDGNGFRDKRKPRTRLRLVDEARERVSAMGIAILKKYIDIELRS
jgi:hypothetical protein